MCIVVVIIGTQNAYYKPRYGIRQAIIFCTVVSSSSYVYLSSFSSPILSCRRLDVYHTSKHDVALLRI